MRKFNEGQATSGGKPPPAPKPAPAPKASSNPSKAESRENLNTTFGAPKKQ